MKTILQVTGVLLVFVFLSECNNSNEESSRERLSLNETWAFYKYPDTVRTDSLVYEKWPGTVDLSQIVIADEKPTEATSLEESELALKAWILPTGSAFLKDDEKQYERPTGNPGEDFPFVKAGFDDSAWEKVDLPHDWAIRGPFYEGADAPVGGGMGRLPSPGVGWYRKSLELPVEDSSKSIFLDIDGAMSYAMVWLNGKLVGGWPYGYASWRLDLTPYVNFGGANQLAIRLDNPPNSSRWYPGGGIYRNVWLTKTNPVHVGHWGSFVYTSEVSKEIATVHLGLTIDNDSDEAVEVESKTAIYALDSMGERMGRPVARFDKSSIRILPGKSTRLQQQVLIKNPLLWGPPPEQVPNSYLAQTILYQEGKKIDSYESPFGIREVRMDPDSGVFVNGEKIYLKGVNQHHDLGALGAAFNTRAAERQLELLREMGCNAIRMAHNPPAPELLELTDRMGFLVIDEIFDSWERKKTPLDFHLIFPDWHVQDIRAFMQRDRNHPSVIMWSLGNEVGEQYTGDEGAALAEELHEIAKDMDPTRPTTISMNFAKPPMALPGVMDVINLNYQGEGIRDAPAYAHLTRGIRTHPLYPDFHEAHPDKVIISSENAAALSSRGVYIFPVEEGISAPAEDGKGADPESQQVSAYELYTAQFGASADKVFRSLEMHPYVAGGFVWSGWDYLGEPTPYYGARSSYYGVIDLAGFKKDRFYLYQAHWRPDFPMVHILPHWNWPDREGMITPVHVFTSGDEVELFLNGKSLGRKSKGQYEYRLRWDEVIYEPGELKAVAYKEGKPWAEEVVKSSGEAAQLLLEADREIIKADGKDLAFIKVEFLDTEGRRVPDANNRLFFEVEGQGEIVATDNGDPTDLTSFAAHERRAFSSKALLIVRSSKEKAGIIKVLVHSEGMTSRELSLESK